MAADPPLRVPGRAPGPPSDLSAPQRMVSLDNTNPFRFSGKIETVTGKDAIE
jgi:hypothetical protein